MATTFANRLGDSLLGAAEPVEQEPVALRLLEHVKVRSLHVLDDADLGHLHVVECANQDWDGVQSGPLRSTPAAFSRNDLEFTRRPGRRTHEDGLKHTSLADGVSQLGELRLSKNAARLVWISAQELN